MSYNHWILGLYSVRVAGCKMHRERVLVLLLHRFKSYNQYQFEKRMQHIDRDLAFVLALRIIYLSQTLFELV